MHLAFDICQGIGVAAAIGIRPFLPSLAVGTLAAGNVEIDFKGTSYVFLQRPWFLLVLVVGAVILSVAERRLSPEQLDAGAPMLLVAAISLVLGALYFAGALAQDNYAAWPGYIGGVLCALVGVAATKPLLARVRSRLDAAAASAVPLYAEGAGLLAAVLSVLAPPVGPIVLVALLWFLLAARRRGERKYAGLRILR